MQRLIRLTAWLALLGALLAAAAGAWLAFTPQGQSARLEASSRSPQELIRYHYEREPPAGPLPRLGKGQQAQALEPIPGITRELRVESPQAIRQALREAQAGTRIVIASGLYPFDSNIGLGNDGRSNAPIVLSAERPGTVWLQFAQLNGIVVDRPYWVFENLDIRGVCSDPGDCEHAFHIIGRGAFTTIRNNRISDFNAHIKVNGTQGVWPDHGMLAHNTLTNNAARSVDAPVVAFDLVGANHWRVQDNLVQDIVHTSAKQTTYGIYMKGASEGGRIERNLVVCSSQDISRPGVRVGISFGGGGTGPTYCRDRSCASYEHRGGLAANNIVAHCNDTGLDVNQSDQIVLAHNTLINTSGIASRGAKAQARLYGNLYEGVAKARDGSRLQMEFNEALDPQNAFMNTDELLLSWQRPPERVPSLKSIPDDFYRRPRGSGSLPGALNQ
jgi:hypothetical protein